MLITKYKTKHQKIFFITILISTYLSVILTLKPCENVKINNYQFNLQQLARQNSIITPLDEENVAINFCKPKFCDKNSLINGYVLLNQASSTSCKSYASNQTGPLAEYYSLIDAKNPQLGISIKYVPYYSLDKSQKQIFIKDLNTTKNFTTIFQNQYSTTLKLYCPSSISLTQQIRNKCTINNNQSTKTNTQTQNYTKQISKLQCDIYLYQGCPKLVVNGFWQFLNANSIAFAIVLWICALFLLILGYLAIRITILIYGIYAGSLISVVFLAQSYNDFYLQNNGIFIFTICLAVILGILYGITLLTVPKMGYINIGIIVAIVFSLLLQNSLLYLTGSLLAFYITFGVAGLIMIIISLLELKNFIVICTSFTGAFFFIRPLGFFLPGYPNQLVNGNKFLSSVKTPWQFYLYLVSILILTGIGIALQLCINKKVIKSKGPSGQYYLEDQGPLRDKLKKVFQFKQIKQMLKNGKKQILQLKNMITDEKNVHFSQQFGQDSQDNHANYIEMQKMSKIQAKQKLKANEKEREREREIQIQKQKNKNKKLQQKQKQKLNFINPKSKYKKQQKKIQIQEIQSSDLGNILDSQRDSDKPKNKKR